MPSFSANITTATTTELIPAPGTGKAIRIHAFDIVSKDMNGTVELKSGSVRLHGINLPATGVGGISKPMAEGHSDPYFSCDSNTALTAVTSASGNVYINGVYSIMG